MLNSSLGSYLKSDFKLTQEQSVKIMVKYLILFEMSSNLFYYLRGFDGNLGYFY